MAKTIGPKEKAALEWAERQAEERQRAALTARLGLPTEVVVQKPRLPEVSGVVRASDLAGANEEPPPMGEATEPDPAWRVAELTRLGASLPADGVDRAEWYRMVREQTGLRQAELADRLEVSRAAIGLRERGKSKITMEHMLALQKLSEGV